MKSWLVWVFVLTMACTADAQTPPSDLSMPSVDDPVLSGYLTQLANTITARTNPSLNCDVTIVASDSLNAYVSPNGKFYITRGLLKNVSNEAEIVFVLAQQLALLQPRSQPIQQYQVKKRSAKRSVLVGAAAGAMIAFGGPFGTRAGLAMIFGEMERRATPEYIPVPTALSSIITDADKAAVEYLHEAGYDPEAAITSLEKLRALRTKGYVEQSQESPPPITFLERIRFVRQRISKLERKDEYLMDSSTFKAMKTRLGEQTPRAENAPSPPPPKSSTSSSN